MRTSSPGSTSADSRTSYATTGHALGGHVDAEFMFGDTVPPARNGAPDTIDCGPGKDKVSFDAALDTIVNCESQGS